MSDLDRLLALRDDIDLSYTNEYDTLKAKLEAKERLWELVEERIKTANKTKNEIRKEYFLPDLKQFDVVTSELQSLLDKAKGDK